MSTDFTPTNNKEVVPASPAPVPPGKKLSRRKVLALAGGGTLVLVVGGGSLARRRSRSIQHRPGASLRAVG